MRNFKSIVALFLALVLSSGAVAQSSNANKSEKRLEKDLRYLASEQLAGRRTGEQGATYAAGYVANQFAQAKLKPIVSAAKGKPNFMQPFPYISGVKLGSANTLNLTLGKGGKAAPVIGKDWMPLGFSPNVTITSSPVVFAGYGINAKDEKYNDFDGIDVRGKIILIFDGNPDAGNPHSAFSRYDIHTKANIAKENGAAGILLIASETNFADDRLAKLTYDRTLGETALPVAGVSRATAAKLLGVEGEAELADITKWIAMKKDAPGNIQIEVTNASNNSAAMKIELEKQTVDAYNVIGMIEGRDPQLKREAIIIGAHYDHLGHGGQGSLDANSTAIHFGADDNASGTSAIIELARRFAKDKDNKRTIIFIAFSGEEEGLLGSKYYVEHPVFPLENTVAMINLDMVGRLKDNKLTIGGIGTASEWRKFVEKYVIESPDDKGATAKDEKLRQQILSELKKQGMETVKVKVDNGSVELSGFLEEEIYSKVMATVVEFKVAKIENQILKISSKKDLPRLYDFALQLSEDGFGPSDHASFYTKKIPVLFFFTGTHLDYHKPSDTADKINFDGLLKVTDFVEEIAKQIDQNAIRPTYEVAKSSGTMGGRRGFNISLGTIPSYGDSTDGLVLDGVRDNSPAAKAGLKAGDKIIKLAGHDVRNVQDYTFVLGEMKAGEEYEVDVIRGTDKLTLKIIPAPAAPR